MQGIRKLGDGIKTIYGVDDLWKKINENKPFVYNNTYIKIEEEMLIIYVYDNTILNNLIEHKNNMLYEIQKVLPKIEKLDIKRTKSEIKKEKTFEKPILKKENKTLYKEENKKIYSDVLKKYEHIEDVETRNFYIAYEAQAKILKKEMQRKNAKICAICNEYFLPLENEKKCIICTNKETKKEIEYIKGKIYFNHTLTKEYAKKIYGIKEKNFDKAKNEILDELMMGIYIKIDETIKYEKKDKIKLDDKLNEYVKYYLSSDDYEIIEKKKNKLKESLKKNILKIYLKEVDIY